MNWRNIKLIYLREIRDQLRDRRTLFMIAVLPLLLYPLLGMSVFQLSQFLQQNKPVVLVLGSEQLSDATDLPQLFNTGRFSEKVLDRPEDAARLQVEFIDIQNEEPVAAEGEQPESVEPDGNETEVDETEVRLLRMAEVRLKSGSAQVVLYFPSDFGERLDAHRQKTGNGDSDSPVADPSPASAEPTAELLQPEIWYNSAREKSRIANMQVEQIINRWKSYIVQHNLAATKVPVTVARPFQLMPLDVAEARQQQAAVWSKILPFVLFVWALTGAFYPAVDLCAGEKERGTLETLLSSPALRGEIVWGKLLTVCTFSIATALLNLMSLGFTAKYIIAQLDSIAPGGMGRLSLPPIGAMLWLLAALLPMAALFSALCLACASFARSTREGQYYLMPLLLVTFPLMLLPMSPGIELSLGNSLIPVTGMVLLLRALVEGNYADALPYVVPVCGVTLMCCLLSIRWAVYQFNQESVLFRESERIDLKRWFVHLVRDRRDTPSLAEVFACVVLIFVIQFFTRIAISANLPESPGFGFLTLLLFISQVVCIALPAMLMALILTAKPLKSLLLHRRPRFSVCAAAVLLAAFLHPVGQQLVIGIQYLYPIQEQVLADSEAFGQLLETAPYAWLPFLLMAVLPAVCEELAFRGFILSGLRHVGSKWVAICLSAVFFGMAHTVIQQSLAATCIGLVLGYVAVQTGSLVPCILFHMTYNGLMLASTRLGQIVERWPSARVALHEMDSGQYIYGLPLVVSCAILAASLLGWFRRLPYHATKEEQLSDVRARQSHLANQTD